MKRLKYPFHSPASQQSALIFMLLLGLSVFGAKTAAAAVPVDASAESDTLAQIDDFFV